MSHRDYLDYRSEPDRAPGVSRYQGVLIVAIVIASCVALRLGCHQVYHYPAKSVAAYLKSLPGVRSVQIESYDDPPGLKVVGATVVLERSDNGSVRFHTPERDGLKSGKRIRIAAIGNNKVSVVDSRGNHAPFIEVSAGGAFEHLLPVRIHGADDVLKAYEDLVVFMDQLPEVSNYSTPDGRIYELRIHR